ncbi:hypothetical protein HHI36_012950 [Cryptolaemus montrouzieri]|uniref:RING-type E3 ubiquitin transferase n=1 Tax=Cryptolaemus montrouzieri TaxID=559131 RepID=A0ABD2NFQ5_9CUCU
MAVPSMMSVPEELMDRLVCIKCGNVLSVCPVYTLPNEDAICGRCVDLKNQDGIRNRSYEILLEILTFPCMNKKFGCMENRTGKNMYEHEQKCLHRRINCPTFASTSCDWFGEIDNLLEHFENNHVLNLMKEPSFEVNFVHKFEEVSLLPYADSLFIVTKLGEPQKKIFWCSVQNILNMKMKNLNIFSRLKS